MQSMKLDILQKYYIWSRKFDLDANYLMVRCHYENVNFQLFRSSVSCTALLIEGNRGTPVGITL